MLCYEIKKTFNDCVSSNVWQVNYMLCLERNAILLLVLNL